MWSEDDKELDAVIDKVARQQTQGAPDAAFKARVFARIDERRHERAWRRLGRMWTPMTIAAAVGLLLMVQTAWHAQPVIAPAAVVTVAPPPPPPPSGLTNNNQRPKSNEPRPTTNDQRLSRARAARSSPIDELAPERLAVGSIAIDALTPAESIELSEMTITSIDVPPLAIEGRQPQQEKP